MTSITSPTDQLLDHQLEQLAAAWNDAPRCEMDTKAGAQCCRPAHWRLNLHGCEHVLICGQHLNAWKRNCESDTRGGSLSPKCVHCGRQFASLIDAYSATPL